MFGTNGEKVAGEVRILLVKSFIMYNFRRVLAYKCKKLKGVRAVGHVACTEDMSIYLKCKFKYQKGRCALGDFLCAREI
jgi:hypothetical protein